MTDEADQGDAELGTVEAERMPVPVHRRVSIAGDMVRVRDKDATGRTLSDHGYTPARARKLAQLLIDGANRLDPPAAGLTVIQGTPEAEGSKP